MWCYTYNIQYKRKVKTKKESPQKTIKLDNFKQMLTKQQMIKWLKKNKQKQEKNKTKTNFIK